MNNNNNKNDNMSAMQKNLQKKDSRGSAPAAGPYHIRVQNSSFVEPQFQHVFLHAQFAKAAEFDHNRDLLWRSISAHILEKCRTDNSTKKPLEINDKNADMEAQHLQKQVFRFRGATISLFFSIC
jgi:hypothetical protein